MSATPRTDAVREANRKHPLCMMRMTDHARQLETELRVAKVDLYLWKGMAATLVKHVPGVSDQDCNVIAAYESLKEQTK